MDNGIDPALRDYVMGVVGAKASTLEEAFQKLDAIFKTYKIFDYADATSIDKAALILGDDEAIVNNFNEKLGNFFIQNQSAIYPSTKKHFDYIVLNTSGINVFTERLALLAEMANKDLLSVGNIVMLVGTHAHRKDLQDTDYLIIFLKTILI